MSEIKRNNLLYIFFIMTGIGGALDAIFNAGQLFFTIQRSFYFSIAILISTILITAFYLFNKKDVPIDFIRKAYLSCFAVLLLIWIPHGIKKIISTSEPKEVEKENSQPKTDTKVDNKTISSDNKKITPLRKDVNLTDNVHDLKCKLHFIEKNNKKIVFHVIFSRPRDGRFSICANDGSHVTFFRDDKLNYYSAQSLKMTVMDTYVEGNICQWIQYQKDMEDISAAITFNCSDEIKKIKEFKVSFSLGDAIFENIFLN